ncbi:hypothetical protein [Rhodospira trueperi]|uniref:Uncharacterized protein n=1 Tax=Rhodospira trueperi TaxID=69960 RepID=A0A1G7CIN8_9PROT|nr:hypothetical protein [Rhodospira trueperi]SDE39111.1 hypothetical protein SAMN05421720_10692 [Rhodospira trueperi]
MPVRLPVLSALAPAVALVLLVTPAEAQGPQEKLDALIRDLNSLIDKGAQRNLADPWYLDELRGLSGRYGETWPRVLMDHTFDSQSGTPDAPWRVRQGAMQVDWTRGLRSQVETAAARPAQDSSRPSDEEVVREIVGGLLGQALGAGQSRSQQQDANQPDPTQPALAVADLSITNAFRLKAEISGRDMPGAADGGLELGVYQPGNAGYRLVLQPAESGRRGRIDLIAVSGRGSARLLDSAEIDAPFLKDEAISLVWARHPGGRTSVSVNDTRVMNVEDRSFNDPFAGVMIVNTGGDWAVKWMTIHGT